MPELLRLILTRAAALVGVEDAFLYLLKPDRQTLAIVAGIGEFASQIGFSVKVGEGLAGRVAAADEPLTVADQGSYVGRSQKLGPMTVRTIVGAPLRGTEGILGVIGLARRDSSGFDEEEIALLDRFGSVACDRARQRASPREPPGRAGRAASDRGGAPRHRLPAESLRARAPPCPGRDDPQARGRSRVPRCGDRPPHRADVADVRADRAAAGPRRGALPAAARRQPAARHRQDRHPRRDPAQAGSLHRPGAAHDATPCRDRPPAPERLVVGGSRAGGDDCARPPRALGRKRLSLRPRRGGDPARGPHRLGRRRLRRAHDRPRLPSRAARRGGARDDAGAAR